MNSILINIKKELLKHVDLEYKKGSINFFKEPIKVWGVRTPIVRRAGRKYLPEVKKLGKIKTFELAEELLKESYNEGTTIAYAWVYAFRNEFTVEDFKIFERWIIKYIDNWAKCDDFCTHVIGFLLEKYPSLTPKVKLWTKSKNRWLRRASAVCYIIPAAKGKFFKEIFWTADALLLDQDDLVQKGYGWMLKSASHSDQKKVFQYVMKNKKKMPRTALRYAIEKMSVDLKRQAMKK